MPFNASRMVTRSGRMRQLVLNRHQVRKLMIVECIVGPFYNFTYVEVKRPNK